MNFTELEQFTKQQSLYSQNDAEVLNNFIRYARMCSDPLNVFKYMEEKSICLFLGNYWINKAETLAEMGECKNAFLCIQEAQSRIGIGEQNQINFEKHLLQLKQKALSLMKRKIVKRNVFEYDLLTEQNLCKNLWEGVEKIVNLYQQKYQEAQKEALQQFQIAQKNKNKSWLAPVFEQQQSQIHKIEDYLRQSSNNKSFLSLRTPFSKRDPMRLTHTLDSVEMVKKKRSTNTKKQNSRQSDDLSERKNHTTPVGRELKILSRRVTFNVQNSDTEKNLINEDIFKQNSSSAKASGYKSNKSNEKRSTILRKSSSFFSRLTSDEKKK